MQECLDYAASSQDEVCALIINESIFYPCKNMHPNPGTNFRISDDDWLAAEDIGEISAIFHSHPMNLPFLTGFDRRSQIQSGLPWWISCRGRLLKFRNVPHLLGRAFKHGVSDCYTLLRDSYHLCGIDLPDFERTNGWWLRGENLYMKNAVANGFHEVSGAEIQPGDVIIRQPFAGADPCHAMVYLGDDTILHHDCQGHISRREPYRLAYVKQTHSIWRHEQCSSLNLQGIFEDIFVKSK